MRKILAIIVVLLLVPVMLGMSCPSGTGSDLQKQFAEGFVAAHNSMALATKLHSEATNYATGGLYANAAAKMAEAKTDSQRAFVNIPLGAVLEMEKQNTGVSERRVIDLLLSRVTSFSDGADHFLTAMRYLQQSNVKAANTETTQGNDSFSKSWQAFADLQKLVQTDPNLSYLRKAIGW